MYSTRLTVLQDAQMLTHTSSESICNDLSSGQLPGVQEIHAQQAREAVAGHQKKVAQTSLSDAMNS